MTIPSTIQTERLKLRRPTLQDAETIFTSYAQDPDVTQYLNWQPHTAVQDTTNYLTNHITKQATDNNTTWVIEQQSTNTLLGMIDLRIDHFAANTGYVLAKQHWGQGYMPEALTAVRKAAMNLPEIYRFWAICDVENKASARVMEKSGLQKEGILRKYFIHPNISPIPRDCHIYATIK